MSIILCRISWMENYNGPDNVQNVSMDFDGESGEMWNFCPCDDGIVRGFVMLMARNGDGEYTGTININNLGADTQANFVNDVNVIFFAMSPEDRINYVVGWYDNATVYRTWRQCKEDYFDSGNRAYSFEVSEKSAHLIPEKDRNIRIITARSKEGRERRRRFPGESFPGMSSVFFENSNPAYVQEVFQFTQEYFSQVFQNPEEYSHSDNLVEDINEINQSLGISETTKTALIDARLGQGRYRAKLIDYWKGCAVTTLSEKSLLRASHIKPWRNSNDEERLNVFNGLLLIPNLDLAFDKGFITFDDDGDIKISDRLTETRRTILKINDDMKIKSELLTEKHRAYLHYHRENVYENWLPEVNE